MRPSPAAVAGALSALSIAAVALACTAPTHPAPPVPTSDERYLVSDGRYAMGTVLEMGLVAHDEAVARRNLDAAFAEVAELGSLLSGYEASSEISLLNRSAGLGSPMAVDPRVSALLARSLEYTRLTRGSFDVTIGPLVTLWTAAQQRGHLPDDSELRRARALVGASRVRVGNDARIELPHAGMLVDLGGIAKGYALDRVVALLAGAGIEDALLSFGESSGWALGAPPDSESGWRLLLRAPGGGFAGLVTLRDQAYSVSSSLGQWSEIEGRRYGHVIDPRSGWPITQGTLSAVVAPDATTAEALSTALVILGPVQGLEVVEAQAGTEALLVDEAGSRWKSSGWDRATRFEASPTAAPPH